MRTPLPPRFACPARAARPVPELTSPASGRDSLAYGEYGRLFPHEDNDQVCHCTVVCSSVCSSAHRLRPSALQYTGQMFTLILTLYRPAGECAEIPVLMLIDNKTKRITKAVRVADGGGVEVGPDTDIDCILLGRRDNAFKCAPLAHPARR